MGVYDIYGNEQFGVYDLSGGDFNQAYDISGDELIGEHKPYKTYDYNSDPDPDKSYVWNYSLKSLRNLQGNRFTIGIQTDTHYLHASHGANYGTPLKNMTKQLYFDFITNMGDIPRGWGDDTKSDTKTSLDEMIRRYTSYAESPVLIAVGNHDNANNYALQHGGLMSDVISKADLYTSTIGEVKKTTTIVEPGNNAMYYYKDFPECRIIVLDTNDYPYQAVSDYDVHGNHHTISTAQSNWFRSVALDTHKPVIVISHDPLVTDVLPDRLIVPDEDKQYSNAPMIPYRANEIVSSINFFKQNGGVVAACIAGHIHRQRSAVVNNVNYITFGNGGLFAEIVFVDFDRRTIQTKVIGSAIDSNGNAISLLDREFSF